MSTESPETGKDWETRHDSVIHLGKLRLLQRFVNIVGLCKIGKSLRKMGKEMKGTNILQSYPLYNFVYLREVSVLSIAHSMLLPPFH